MFKKTKTDLHEIEFIDIENDPSLDKKKPKRKSKKTAKEKLKESAPGEMKENLKSTPPEEKKVLIEFKDVCKKYVQGDNEFYALKDASLTINEGEMVVILGP
ncbi:MAG: hypothetical protein IKX95_00395, partial [Lachnospiraceae bacterium]|nr:hypothetical protein [Lachnospiraceae bacterium]